MTQTKARRPLTRADLTDGERRHLAACVHEAGHAVACAMLGGEIRSAVVTNGKVSGLHGFTTFAQLSEHIDPRVTYAGMFAEARWEYGPRPTAMQLRHLRTANSSDDRRLCAAGVQDMYGNPTAEARSAVPPLLDRRARRPEAVHDRRGDQRRRVEGSGRHRRRRDGQQPDRQPACRIAPRAADRCIGLTNSPGRY
ncbi:hypothetical protein A4G26_25810 [Mycobacterium kansasii]|uniref:M50 family metallopeptidase n=1 Tax=Mycobacterium innocens TaxID=2341083 RepID=UPI0007BE9167|nr:MULTISPECIES: M50 family metallopeptidase [Mycobacterium]KZS70060.1 hypothetical protein A4G26_25810 [Mycobacterium kansasii]